jgi:hypothetical protein
MVTYAVAAVAHKTLAHPELRCRRSPGLVPAEIRLMVETTLFPTTIVAARAIAEDACVTETRETNRCTGHRPTTTLIGVWAQKPKYTIVPPQ